MNSNGWVKNDPLKNGFTLNSTVYMSIYALIYLHIIFVERIVSRDGLPCGFLLSGILKIEKNCPGPKVRFPGESVLAWSMIAVVIVEEWIRWELLWNDSIAYLSSREHSIILDTFWIQGIDINQSSTYWKLKYMQSIADL